MTPAQRMKKRSEVEPGGPLEHLLALPLFYKLLVANSLIVILGAVGGTLITASVVRAEPAHSTVDLVGLFAGLGTVVSVAVNALIIRAALAPVRALENAAEAVRAGDDAARAPHSAFADRDFRRLTETFNEMLDRLRENRSRLRRLASEATRAAESERRRIAQELHDDTAQRLASVLVRLRLVSGAEDAAARESGFADLREEIDGVLRQVRRTAQALRPEALEEMGLVPAVRRHARRLEEEHDVEITIAPLPTTDPRLSADAELALYRIIQEALGNAARHADANLVAVDWSTSEEALTVRVDDDGTGFDVPATLSHSGRLGLFGMMERASHHGGRVAIDSAPGRGTSVRATFPFAAEGRRG
ncbi:MAG: ATP-binding protein [Gemmatimonadota bacterium]